MSQEISKSSFKAHALEIMRNVEQSGDEVIITSHGKPSLIIKKYQHKEVSPLDKLRGSVKHYSDPVDPVAEDDWELS